MRAFVPLLCLLASVGCGQDIDHPQNAAACDPATMKCAMSPPLEGGIGDGNSAGAGSSDDAVASIPGRVIGFGDDFFDQGVSLSATAEVSAEGRSGARVKTTYDRTSFQLEGVLKTAVNWFLTVPAAGSGFSPTLIPVDTRTLKSDEVVVAVAPSLQLEGILQSLGTAPSDARAQIVVHVIDAQGRSVTGVTTDFTAEVTAYRTAGVWLASDEGTDDSGLIFIGNAQVGSALTSASVNLRGAATARLDLEIMGGATTVVTAVVVRK
jgi:hypothetical protein